jgi:hypothetical protein
MAKGFTQLQRHRLRDLAADAHATELSDAMLELFEDFQRWGGEEIGVFDLNDRIHEFHDGVSRDLYKRYVMMNSEFSVSYALAHGILSEEEVGEDLVKALAVKVESLKDPLGGEPEDD